MKEIKLKPCPFCGNENPTLAEIRSWVVGNFVWFVGCENEGCYFGDSLGETFDSKEEAIEAWNKRS